MPAAVIPGLSFTALDFETANPKRASVCSVGAVKVRDGVVVDAFDSLVHPPPGHREFGARNVAVHGITARDVAGAPTWDVAYGRVAAFAGADTLVAHNASFDRSVLVQASEAHGIAVPRSRWLCTRDAARAHLGLASYRLPDVSAALDVPPHAHHDAAADARQCALVLVALCRRLGPGGKDLLGERVRTW